MQGSFLLQYPFFLVHTLSQSFDLLQFDVDSTAPLAPDFPQTQILFAAVHVASVNGSHEGFSETGVSGVATGVADGSVGVVRARAETVAVDAPFASAFTSDKSELTPEGLALSLFCSIQPESEIPKINTMTKRIIIAPLFAKFSTDKML